MAKPDVPKKIAILGGGVSAMTAAFELSDPALGGRYEITLYQMGWRLGGQGASGRNAERNQRIEEHGLHIWFGFYDNALDVMRRCYDELGRPEGEPLARLEDAFKRQSHIVLKEKTTEGWTTWPIEFVENDAAPGGHPSVLALLQTLLNWIRDYIHARPHLHAPVERNVLPAEQRHKSLLETVKHTVATLLLGERVLAHTLAAELHDLVASLEDDGSEHPKAALGLTGAAIALLANAVWFHLKDRVDDDVIARREWMISYLGLTFAKGLVDDILTKGYHSVDHLEYRDWLYGHATIVGADADKANRLAYWSPLIQAFYDASFAYLEGDTDQPNMAAGVAIRTSLRILFGYKGAVLYEMQAGMGDTVFTPLYLVLLGRGVRFEFFNRVEALRLDETSTRIEAIEVSRQVALKSGRYDPLVKVKDLLCWPNEPRYEQLEDGDALQASGANLEHYRSGWTDTGGRLRLEAGKDFDRVVLGISPAALALVCGELITASERWRTLIENLKTVRTQACQLWFTMARQQMGLTGPEDITTAYIEPWSSIADFSHLIRREAWPNADEISFLGYSCGVMPEGEEPSQSAADAQVEASLKNYLETDLDTLWPGACRPGEEGIDWSVLYAPAGVEQEKRLGAQYIRANIDPMERYVLAQASDVDFRLKAGDTGFENLVATGAWIDNDFIISSVEGAVMSGMQAARAISGYPETIVGEDD